LELDCFGAKVSKDGTIELHLDTTPPDEELHLDTLPPDETYLDDTTGQSREPLDPLPLDELE